MFGRKNNALKAWEYRIKAGADSLQIDGSGSSDCAGNCGSEQIASSHRAGLSVENRRAREEGVPWSTELQSRNNVCISGGELLRPEALARKQ